MTYKSLILIVAMAFASFAPTVHAVDSDKNEVRPEARMSAEEALKRFTVNVTEMALAGKIPEVYGSREKTRAILEIFAKSGMTSVYALGDAGSGKTAHIEWAAIELFQTREMVMYRLDINALEAGAGHRGDLENRLQSLLDAFDKKKDIANTKRVLFIDEFHIAMNIPDFMNKLKNLMARGEMFTIMATTHDEFKEFVEKDDAVKRRGQALYFKTPTLEAVIGVLEGIHEKMEKKHGIKITPQAMRAAAELAERYYSDMPPISKALDIIDNAAARAVLNQKLGSYDVEIAKDKKEMLDIKIRGLQRLLESTTGPTLSEAERIENQRLIQQIETLKNESAAFDNMINAEAKQVEANSLKAEIEKFKQQVIDLRAMEQSKKSAGGLWSTLFGARSSDADAQEKIENGRKEAERLEKVVIPALEANLKASDVEGKSLRDVVVDAIDVGRLVGQAEGIPADIVNASPERRVELLSEALNEKLLGNERAKFEIVNSLEMRILEMMPVTGPQGIYLLDGGENKGKTTLQLALAKGVFGSPGSRITLDLGDYNSGESWRLLGSATGYQGSHEGGAIDEVRRKKHSVVVIKGAERAPPNILQLLEQGLREGKMKDTTGRLIDLRNAIIVFEGDFTNGFAGRRGEMTLQQIEAEFGLKAGELEGKSPHEIEQRVLEGRLKQLRWPEGIRESIGVKVMMEHLAPGKLGQAQLNELKEFFHSKYAVTLKFDSNVAEAMVKSEGSPQEAKNMVNILLKDVMKQKLGPGEIELTFVANADGKGGYLRANFKGQTVAGRFIVFPEVNASTQRQNLQAQVLSIYGIKLEFAEGVAEAIQKADKSGAMLDQFISELKERHKLAEGTVIRLSFKAKANGKGGNLQASVAGKSIGGRSLVFNGTSGALDAAKSAEAKVGRADGQAGHPSDPRNVKEMVKESVGRGKRR